MNGTETDNQANQDIEEQPRYFAELIDHIITQLEDFFSSHLDEIFKRADDYLFKAADESSSTTEQNDFFECMKAITC